MDIHESAEDYLEAILMLRQEKGYSRSVDIAGRLGVTKPSVSFAMKKLRENGYITMDEDSLITLTDKGSAIAERILDRHRTLTAFLCDLGVSPENAREDACRMEHDLSEEAYAAMKKAVRDHQLERLEACQAYQAGACDGECVNAPAQP